MGKFAADLAPGLERWLARRQRPGRGIATAVATCLLLLVFAPGAGLRNLWAHVRHWNDPAYNAPLLARRIMADIPESARVAVDSAYVIDFYQAGRGVVVITILPITLDVRDYPFEYAVLASQSLRLYRAVMPDLVFVRSYGDPNDPLAEYAELYRHVAAQAHAP